MSDTTQIHPEERPFALRFHGFVEDCPHAVHRFTTFCTADLNLSAEETVRILAQPGSAVICRKDSRHDLSSLADAFQELGVRVSIADICDEPTYSDVPSAGQLAEISPQLEELLRAPSLRVIESPSAPGEYVLAVDQHRQTRNCDGTSHARTTIHNHDKQKQGGRTMRDYHHHLGATSNYLAKSMRHRRTRSIRLRTYGRRQTDLTGIQMIGMLIAGLACLIAINRAFIGKPELSDAASSYRSGTSWGLADSEERDTAASNAVYKHYDGTVSRGGYVLTLSSRMHEGSLSARVLVVTPLDTHESTGQSPSTPQLRRAESDTTFLRESEPGVWTGDLVTYLFIEHHGQMRRVPARTEIRLQMNQDDRTGHANVELTGIIPRGLRNLDDVAGTARVNTGEGTALHLKDRVTLRAASVSF